MNKDPFSVLSHLLIDDFGIDPAVIHRDVVLSDLGLDSLTLMEFIFAAEDAFAMRIPEEKMDPNQVGLTLGAICLVIESMKPTA
jgi:acyl carrier protein